MNALDAIRYQIQKLYTANPNIHINVAVTSPKVILKNEPVRIKSIYPHIFQIEEQSSGAKKTYTLQYSDILLHFVEIIELNKSENTPAGIGTA